MLRRSEAQMLEQLFKSKCDPDNKMSMCQFLLLAMEKSLVSSKHGLKVFREIFKQASDGKVIFALATATGVYHDYAVRIDHFVGVNDTVQERPKSE